MSPGEHSSTGTVLVIDDDRAVTGVIEAVLTKVGYQVHVAHDGLEGVRMAGEIGPDLILMDIAMPGMDGYAATERLKNTPALKDVPVVFLSGRTAGEDGGLAFTKGGVTFVRKPFTNQQLRDLVKLVMESVNG